MRLLGGLTGRWGETEAAVMMAASRSFSPRPEADGHMGVGSVRPSHCPVDTPAKGRPPLYQLPPFFSFKATPAGGKGLVSECVCVCVCVCV